jgi:hypothetical protein
MKVLKYLKANNPKRKDSKKRKDSYSSDLD